MVGLVEWELSIELREEFEDGMNGRERELVDECQVAQTSREVKTLTVETKGSLFGTGSSHSKNF